MRARKKKGMVQAEPGESTASHDPCYEVTATTITVHGPLGLVRCDHLANPDAEEEQSADSDGENEERLFSCSILQEAGHGIDTLTSLRLPFLAANSRNLPSFLPWKEKASLALG